MKMARFLGPPRMAGQCPVDCANHSRACNLCCLRCMRRKVGCHPPCVNKTIGRALTDTDSILTLIAQILALLCVLEWICQPQCACLLIWEKKDDTNRTILLGLCGDWLIYVYVRWNFCLEPRQCLAMCARVPEYCHLCRGNVGSRNHILHWEKIPSCSWVASLWGGGPCTKCWGTCRTWPALERGADEPV